MRHHSVFLSLLGGRRYLFSSLPKLTCARQSISSETTATLAGEVTLRVCTYGIAVTIVRARGTLVNVWVWVHTERIKKWEKGMEVQITNLRSEYWHWRNLQTKLHSKIILSNIVGVISLSSMVKLRGQNSNTKMAKRTAKNGQKISGDDDVADIASLVPGVNNSRLFNGLELDRRNRFTMASHVRSGSGWSWTFSIARVTLHDYDLAPLTPQKLARAIFSPSVWPSSSLNFDVGPSPSNSTEKIYQSLWFWSAVFLLSIS